MKMYVIPGDPIPLARARCGKGKVWDAQKQLKLFWGLQLQQQHHNLPLYEGPLELNVTFYFPIPKTSKKNEQELTGTYHYYRPDISNCIKFVEDVATGILYKDDSIISSIISKKIYDVKENIRTEFFLRELR